MVHVYQLGRGVVRLMPVPNVWCDAGPSGPMHGQQLRQLEDTMVTLAVVCWQLASQLVSAYHLISRHSGKMWG